MEQTVSASPNQSANHQVTSGPSPRAVAICEHIKDNGVRCGTPALRDRHFCYFHSRAHRPQPRVGHRNYTPPVMESREALVLAVTHALQSLTSGEITPRFANSIFYGVHLAAKILRMSDTPSEAPKPNVITEMPRVMECIIEGRPVPEPADYAPDKVASLAADLIHLDEMSKLYDVLAEGPKHSSFARSRLRLENHTYATQRLTDMGLFHKYNLNRELFAHQQAQENQPQPEAAEPSAQPDAGTSGAGTR